MSKTQVFLLFLLSILFGLAAVYFAKQWMDEQTVPEIKVEKVLREPVVVAAQNLDEGRIIDASDLTTKLLEKDWRNEEQQYSSIEELIGKVAKEPIYAGEMLHKNRVVQQGEGSTLASLIPEDKRAVTIRVNDVIGVGGFLLPGNKVDVLNSVKRSSTVRTTTVLKDIRVLAVDQTAKTNDNKPIIVRAVTLEVTPREAEQLLTAKNTGDIQLALRNPHQVDKPVARRVYTPPPSVTIIKGTNSSNVRVKE